MAFGLAAKTLLIWAAILLLAILNGILRESVFIPQLGRAPGLTLSGLLLSVLILLVAYFSLPWLATRQPGQLVAIWFGWLGLTLIFEFAFGLLRGTSLSALLDAYTFKGGNIWPVVLLVTACAPYLAAKLRGWV